MTYSEIKVGLVIQMPEEIGGLGVILDCTKQQKNLFKVIILTESCDVLVGKLVRLDYDTIDFKSYECYDTARLAKRLKTRTA